MSNNLLTVIVVAVLAWTFVAPAFQLAPRPVASRATEQPAAPSSANAGKSTLQAHQPPVPLARNLPAMLVPPAAPEVGMPQASLHAPDGSSGKAAAKSAIEADGYKGVTVLGKSADGTWRAKAYRGATEVQLIVDDAGSVSAE